MSRAPSSTRIGPLALLACWIAATAAALVAHLVLTRGNRVVPFPFHHDDYDTLVMSVHRFGMPSVRPVSRFAMAVLGDLGTPACYGALFAAVVLTVVLALVLAVRLLDVVLSTRALVAAAAVVGLGFFLFEFAPEIVRYTGVVTNLVSLGFGLPAAILALAAPAAGVGSALGAVAFLALSVYAKEDALLLVLLAAAIGTVRARRAGDRRGVRRGVALGVALGAVAASAFAYGRWVVASPFQAGGGVYALSFAPADLARGVGWYLAASRFALLAAAVLAATTLAAARGGRALLPGLGWTWLAIASLMLPYAPLVQHRYENNVLNWLPLMLAAVTVAWTAMLRDASRPARRAVLAAAAALAVIGWLVATPGRERVAGEFTLDQMRNRAIVGEVTRLRDELARHPVVVVEGVAQFRQPWMFTDGGYLDAIVGRDLRWVVVAPPGSFLAWVYPTFGRALDDGQVAVVPAPPPDLATAPRLVFDADLRARLVDPAPGWTAAGGVR